MLRCTQVDVFTDRFMHGNTVAMVHDADRLTNEQMQAFGPWTNLSEATVLVGADHPDADYGSDETAGVAWLASTSKRNPEGPQGKTIPTSRSRPLRTYVVAHAVRVRRNADAADEVVAKRSMRHESGLLSDPVHR